MKNIDTKNITLLEKTESAEAEELYRRMKSRFSFLYVIPLVIIFILLIVVTIIGPSQQMVLVMLICNVALEIIGLCIYRNVMRPFKELLDIAKHNDWIRHEEKIRYKERKRILAEEKNSYSVADIKQTIQEYKDMKDDKKN